MDAKRTLSVIAVFAVVGVLFSGYLTYYTYASGRPGCEVFIAHLPSCFYGAIMYAVVFALALSLAAKAATRNAGSVLMTVIGLAGVAFAGYLTWVTLSSVSCAGLEIYGIPPCVYGLVMYLVLLVLAIASLSKKR